MEDATSALREVDLAAALVAAAALLDAPESPCLSAAFPFAFFLSLPC